MPVQLPDFLLAPLLSQVDDKFRARDLRRVWNEELSDEQRVAFWGPLLQKTFDRRNPTCAQAVLGLRPDGVELPKNLARIAQRKFEKALEAEARGKGNVREARDTYEELMVALFQATTTEELDRQKLPKDFLDLAFREGLYNLVAQWSRYRPSQVEHGRSLVMAMKPAFQDPRLVDWRGYPVTASLRSLALHTNSRRLAIVEYWASERSVGFHLEENRRFRRQVRTGEPLPEEMRNSILATQEWLFRKWTGLHEAGLLRDTPLVRLATGVLLEQALKDGPRSTTWVVASQHGYTIPKETMLFFITVEKAREWGQKAGSYLATHNLTTSVSDAFSVFHLHAVPLRLQHMDGWDQDRMSEWTEGFLEGWGDKELPVEWGNTDRCVFLSNLKAAFEKKRLEKTLSPAQKTPSRPRI